jgi:hypothetical protein
MKQCPHCGAAIKVSAATFCTRCKRPLRKPGKKKAASPGKSFQNEQFTGNSHPSQSSQALQKKVIAPHNHQTQAGKARKKKKSWLLSILIPNKEQPSVSEDIPVKKTMDENYDGYYEDRPTDDNAQNKESFDPELIKRIALIAGGAVLLMILSIIIMNLL